MSSIAIMITITIAIASKSANKTHFAVAQHTLSLIRSLTRDSRSTGCDAQRLAARRRKPAFQ